MDFELLDAGNRARPAGANSRKLPHRRELYGLEDSPESQATEPASNGAAVSRDGDELTTSGSLSNCGGLVTSGLTTEVEGR